MLEIICLICASLITLLILFFGIFKTIQHKKAISAKNIKNFFPLILSYTFLFIPYLKEGEFNFYYIIKSLYKGIKSLTFDIDPDFIIKNDNIFFRIIVVINILITIYLYSIVLLSLVFTTLVNNTKLKLVSLKDHDILLDYDEQVLSSYQKDYKNTIVWKNMTKDEFNHIKKKYIVKNQEFNETNLLKYLKNKKGRINLVSFVRTDDECLKILSTFINAYKTAAKSKNKDLFASTYLYLNCAYENRYMFEKLVRYSEVAAKVIIYNKHELISQKFILDYPLTSFLNSELDYQKALIKKDVDISCIFIGFGKVNKELLNKQISNNVFLTEGKNGLEVKTIDYHIIDNNDFIEDKNLNHYLLKDNVSPELKSNKEKLFRIHEKANCDINSHSFYDIFDKMLSVKAKTNVNQIVVSLGSDSENIDFALKIVDHLKHKNINGKNLVFCRIKNESLLPFLKQQTKEIIFFGDDSSIINHEIVIKKFLESFGIMRNNQYCFLNNNLSADLLNKWMTLPTIKRINNIAVGLNTRFKLNLLGLDCVKKSEANDKKIEGLTKEEYFERYFYPDKTNDHLYDYQTYYHNTKQINARNSLAYQEHLRWCAFFITQGYDVLPLNEVKYTYNKEKDEISVYKDDVLNKKHVCLIPFVDLDKYHQQNKKQLQVLAKEYNLDLTKGKYNYNGLIDTYQYDYQTMDEMYDFLEKNDYIIINKKDL